MKSLYWVVPLGIGLWVCVFYFIGWVVAFIAFIVMLTITGIGEFILGLPYWQIDDKTKLNLVITLCLTGAVVVLGNFAVWLLS